LFDPFAAGYNTYVGEARAKKLGLANTTQDTKRSIENIFLQSAPGGDGSFRESVRLEGKTRFDRGLFILDVEHMPNGWYVHSRSEVSSTIATILIAYKMNVVGYGLRFG
jgi:hypothetical protein